MIANILVKSFVFWKTKLGFRGAGFLLRRIAPYIKGLHKYPMKLEEGQVIHLDVRDYSGMAWILFKASSIIGEEQGLVSSIVSLSDSSSVIWDIGGNCGLISYAVAKRADFRSIHFFEPNPSVYKIASDALRPFSKVSGYNVAVSDAKGQRELSIPNDGFSSASATLNPSKTGREGKKITIKSEIGDELIDSQKVPTPSIIKVDVEGHELEVLKGLSGCIEMHHPIVLFEHISLTDEEVLNAVPKGYKVYAISDDDGTLKQGFNRSFGHNSAYIPDTTK